MDENTQHPVGESPTKKVGSGGATTRIPKKTPPVSPVKVPARSRATGGAAGGGRVPRSKSVPKPFTSWATPPSTSESAKKGAYSFHGVKMIILAIIFFIMKQSMHISFI